MGSGRALFAPL